MNLKERFYQKAAEDPSIRLEWAEPENGIGDPFADEIAAAERDSSKTPIALTQNYTAGADDDRLKVNGSVTIDLNGYTINRNLSSRKKNGHVIEVFGGGTLTIKDSSFEGSGKITGGWPDRGGGIYVNKNASLTIESGSISGNHSAKAGGGINRRPLS